MKTQLIPKLRELQINYYAENGKQILFIFILHFFAIDLLLLCLLSI